ncbi:AraC family transcriptional regulator [Pleomorphomonas sp. PLEO]|uniref:AraC family transcriptional regulator n=1 Tax=Pleomorphomonas sp. PLEO TaxID=3239306 RepID=UPI00351DAE3F
MEQSNFQSLLGEVLRRVRITEAMQYCYMPSGDWETDATPVASRPKDGIGFHILATGTCWLEFGGRRTTLREGDIAAFPFGTPHTLGAGSGGQVFDPGGALPPMPWPETPMLRFGNADRLVRILCGYVRCEAVHFLPFRQALPEFIHVSTAANEDWLSGVVLQIVREVDMPRGGGTAILERLTEIALLEVLRRQLSAESTREIGWLAAIRDPILGRCLKLIHDDPGKPWSLGALIDGAGASRSVISERFTTMLGTGPISYIRDWRLFLARERLKQGSPSIGSVAEAAGYSSEAAFNRAFARAYGVPPAAFRESQRNSS